MTRKPPPTDDDLNLAEGEVRIDALLDEALAPDVPGPQLVDAILAQTSARLDRRRQPSPVLAWIGSPLLKVAAVIAVVGTVVVALLNAPEAQWEIPKDRTAAAAPTIAEIEQQLAAIVTASETPDTDLDEQIDLLALQVELVQYPQTWDDAEAVSDQMLLLSEIDQYAGESSVIF